MTLATLMVEILDSRLLSVLTWYHLAFLSVSLAMLGMASGAVLVFLGGARFQGDAAMKALPRWSLWLALSIPLSHLLNLTMPIPMLEQISVMEVTAILLTTLVLGAPFLLAGVVVTIALTRTGGSVSRLYAADLLGAALGCLLVIPLLGGSNLSSVVFIAGGAAAAGAYCFHRASGAASHGLSLGVCALLIVIAGLNAMTDRGFGVVFAKNRIVRVGSGVEWSAWNTHSYVTITAPGVGPAFYWGRGRGAEKFQATSSLIAIDGEAGTPITKWDGDARSLEWVSYDVTTLPYHLRHGAVGIIGVGGGRDVLSAIAGGNSPITGVELNGNLLWALQGPYRDFAGIAARPEVELVHSEARSYLSRTDKQFDVLQMSLIDTWAATGAGAFTLSENGLYTVEAWRVFLGRLKPGGLFSVSRWFSPTQASETSRLLSLAVAALLDRGVARPLDHLAMLSRNRVATLVVSNAPLTPEDRTALDALAASRGFTVLLSPWSPPPNALLAGITQATTRAALDAATWHPDFDFSPPTDSRPFFFNTLKATAFSRAYDGSLEGGVVSGNLRATSTLVLLFVIASVLVVGIIGAPLLRSGLPTMDAGSFALSVTYFAMIGAGYMLIQVPILQRFSVYLGHPTWTLAIILFSMIFFTGVGSFVSDRFPVLGHPRMLALPLVIAATVIGLTLAAQPIIDSTIQLGLAARCLIVIACTAPVATLLGFCFPIGMSLVGRLSPDATAWMWGVNGAAGVLASIVAVGVSMWAGINVNLVVAAALYAGLTLPASALARRARAPR